MNLSIILFLSLFSSFATADVTKYVVWKPKDGVSVDKIKPLILKISAVLKSEPELISKSTYLDQKSKEFIEITVYRTEKGEEEILQKIKSLSEYTELQGLIDDDSVVSTEIQSIVLDK